jgi:hypothetical protein
MGKTGADFDPDAYAPVADRIRLFYQQYPTGRILTTLVSRTHRDVVFEARVYRTASDREPSATGWAAEREGDGDINTVACLENTETSAIGRALANLGFTASRQRPSAEEMAKASRARMRLATPGRQHRNVSESAPPQQQDNHLADALDLIRVAERLGLRSTRAQSLRVRMMASVLTPDTVDRLAMVLRRWIDKRRRDALNVFRPR